MQLVMWIVGVLTGLAVFKIAMLFKEKKLNYAWYHWLILALLYLGGVFVVAFVGTSFAEGEPQAAGMSILIFGGAFIVVALLLYRFLFARRYNKKVVEKELVQ